MMSQVTGRASEKIGDNIQALLKHYRISGIVTQLIRLSSFVVRRFVMWFVMWHSANCSI